MSAPVQWYSGGDIESPRGQQMDWLPSAISPTAGHAGGYDAGKSRAPHRAVATAVGSGTAFVLLLLARLASAALNIEHDCDESYNYIEPLHFLVHGSGMQTWEYGAQFALRPYLYLLLHAVVVAPASLVFGASKGKLFTFYCLKAALGLVSAATEALLYRAVARRYAPAVAHTFLLFLCISAGMFIASTAMLPSSFTMYTLTAAAAYMLDGEPTSVIVWAAVGILWGWSVAAIAFIPYALYVLGAGRLARSIGVALLALAGTLGPLVLVDRWYYGRWTCSLLNFMIYNVVGGGDSALYGVEPASYYLRNAFNNFQLLLPLALLAPLLLVTPLGDAMRGRDTRRWAVARLLLALSPLYMWGGAITALPHKEERFLYVVYPLVCLAAAVSLVVLARTLGRLLRSRLLSAGLTAGLTAFLLGSCALGASRSAALVLNYGAPMQLYRHLPEVTDAAGPPIHVCVGAEWYRFPSAFFLPGQRYRLQFIKSGFSGLLPRQFDLEQGGTRAELPQFNDRNREEPANYWTSTGGCAYLVTLREDGRDIDDLGEGPWEMVASRPFVDQARSPAWSRAFYLPGLSARHNKYADYVLLRRGSANVEAADGANAAAIADSAACTMNSPPDTGVKAVSTETEEAAAATEKAAAPKAAAD